MVKTSWMPTSGFMTRHNRHRVWQWDTATNEEDKHRHETRVGTGIALSYFPGTGNPNLLKQLYPEPVPEQTAFFLMCG
jgi:hypothetical protein